MWTVQEAKTKLSEVLQRARGGEAQVVGAQDPRVVISMSEYQRLTVRAEEPSRQMARREPRGSRTGLCEIELPPRGDTRPIPFADWTDEELRC